MKQKLIVLFMLLFSFHLSYSQGVISGKVVDQEEGNPLIGATVVIKGTTTGTATNLDGSFSLEVEPGEHIVEFTYVGYLKKEIEVTVRDGEEKNMGKIEIKPDAIGLDEVKVVANFAKDRETPVAVSKIKPIEIEEKLGSQAFPELLKSTPSVYATKGGGGFGDGDINMRGFDGDNIGVLINGVPVNDMENGRVYWSNWAGLSSVTKTIQVQRGLGASKLAISSVGGTMNILTESTQAEQGGSAYQGLGNDGYLKTGFTVSTGLMDNDWAVTFSGQYQSGDGYVEATKYKAYTYFFNISKRLNDKHRISLTGFGTPQWHNQRGSYHMVEDYREAENGGKLNTHYGYWNGDIMMTGYAYNKYHKPQISLNHYWKINNTSRISTALYVSFGNGGGKGTDGSNSGWLEFEYPSGKPTDETRLTEDGLLDYGYVHEQNRNSNTGSQAIFTMRSNSHDWYGVLSSYNTKFGNTNITAGFDGRFYRGYHYTEISNLLGGDYYLDNSNINRPNDKPLEVGDKIGYYNLGDVGWAGIFVQGEYVTDKYSGFLSTSLSNKSYRRIDRFAYFPQKTINQIETDTNLRNDYLNQLGERRFNQAMQGQYSDWVHYLTYSVKGGFNYNINDRHNVFVNGGYFTRAPYFSYAFIGYTNTINETLEPEKIISSELGYGYLSKKIKIDLTIYRTEWNDKGYTESTGQGGFAKSDGIDALHQGVELETRIKATKMFRIKIMGSYGDWMWNENAVFDYYDRDQNYVRTAPVYIKDVSVGGSAQTTAALGIEYQPFPEFKIAADFNHYSRLYSDFDVEERITVDNEGINAWKMPDYQLLDVNARYDFDIAGFGASIYGNVYNILDTEYISYALDGRNHDVYTSPVYFGFGRTWSLALKLRF